MVSMYSGYQGEILTVSSFQQGQLLNLSLSYLPWEGLFLKKVDHGLVEVVTKPSHDAA